MITDHAFVGRSEWGIDPPALSPCQVCGLPRNYQYGAPLSPPITISSSGPGTAIVTPVYQEQPG